MADDWFRSENWNADIEQRFYDKLKRAKGKGQYLRIQAYSLIASHPEISLKLLDEYFAQDDQFDYSQACAHKAEAYLNLNNIDAAIRCYEEALAREEIAPNVITDSYIDLPFLIATKKLQNHFPRALDIFDRYASRLTPFPINVFKQHAAQALILSEQNQGQEAKAHAIKALDAAQKNQSEFKRHSSLGLVGAQYDLLEKTLASIANK